MTPEEEKLQATAAPAPEMPEETPTEAPQETPAEAPPNPLRERMMKSRPDAKLETDEDIQNAIIGHMDDLEKYKGQAEAANAKLLEVMDANPEIVDILRDLTKGATFAEALSRNVDIEDLTPAEGDPDYEAWGKNKASRLASKAEMEKRRQEFADNVKLSEQTVKEFAKEQGMTEAEAEKQLEAVEQLFSEMTSGKISKEFLMKMKKALSADQEKEEAKNMGKIEGKNEAIIAHKTPVGDGLPKLSGGGSMGEGAPGPKPDIFDRAKRSQKEPPRG